MIFHTEEYTRRELNLSTSQGKKKKECLVRSWFSFRFLKRKEKETRLPFYKMGKSTWRTPLHCCLWCSVRSSLLREPSCWGLQAKASSPAWDSTLRNQWWKNIILLAIKNICSYMIRDYGKNVTLQLPKGAVPRKRPPYLSLGYVTCWTVSIFPV